MHSEIDSLLTGLRSGGVTLHLGCGDSIIPGVVNCDLHSTRAQERVDATNLARFDDGTVHMIEHHHMIEHLSVAELKTALPEWARVLMPGGFLVVTAPDLERVLQKWMRMADAEKWQYGIKMVYGSQEHPGMFHKNGFTPHRLGGELGAVGLRQEWFYRGYPRRPTPSFISIARKIA